MSSMALRESCVFPLFMSHRNISVPEICVSEIGVSVIMVLASPALVKRGGLGLIGLVVCSSLCTGTTGEAGCPRLWIKLGQQHSCHFYLIAELKNEHVKTHSGAKTCN